MDSVVFSVKAVDADGDEIHYNIDRSSVSSPLMSSLNIRPDDIRPLSLLQADTWFFRIEVPNSGEVVLSKPLDYESRTRLQLVMWAEVTDCFCFRTPLEALLQSLRVGLSCGLNSQESNTEEKFNVSAVLTVHIQDGDDQYPHFLPCTLVSLSVPVCMNPVYTANISQKHQVPPEAARYLHRTGTRLVLWTTSSA